MDRRFNNEIRIIIENTIDNMKNNYVPTDLSFTLLTEAFFYKYTLLFKPKSFEVFYTMLCQIVYLDAYKTLSYSKKILSITEEEELYWELINDIEDFLDLYTKISDDPELFAYMLKCSYYYQKSNGLIKSLQTKSLTDEENKRLLEIAPSHEEDLNYYSNHITLKRLIKNYKAQIKFYANNGNEKNEERALDNIVNFIRQLSLVDKDNFNFLVEELINNYYIVTKTNNINIDHIISCDDLNFDDMLKIVLDDQTLLKNLFLHTIKYYNGTSKEIEEEVILRK